MTDLGLIYKYSQFSPHHQIPTPNSPKNHPPPIKTRGKSTKMEWCFINIDHLR